ncbi:sigma-54-dependent transcriptional regulator [Desulfoluna butyratoxydans]|uniref:Signal transduction response regulator receiver domain n=1 Tax=Desulfoluna butyratoxydans TaxID=231438 RepID=A0A4U8YJU4_9BACT|nr:sigma-54 dependent transcriptional regulator [Desulfoluna butyratoxydans]VFQ44066.1 signal transduction response regulator receiver domain [Desulfoluna butyratoxydans]
MARVLIIDDDETLCYSLSRVVRSADHEALTAQTLHEGLALAEAGDVDAVFLDVRLPDGNGLEALPALQKAPSAPEVIILTGLGDPDGAELAMINGAWDYIEKTASKKEITLTLARALQYRREKVSAMERNPVVALNREGIVGESPVMNDCFDLVARAAASDASVLITGETGTGKELFARAVHANSLRQDAPFVIVDCASIPESLVESLLFGHVKGAFTGADRDRVGLIAQAHNGTLFLDEVGELPMSLQKAFLRVLQEHTIRPVGSREMVTSHFRLVCATNRDLEAMVKEGTFRKDLLYRIHAFSLELPPLRQRGTDLREIASYHIARFCKETGRDQKGVSSDFFDVLEKHSWPGNVRELVNVLDQALISSRHEPTLFPKHLPMKLRARVARARVSHGDHPSEAQGPEVTPHYDPEAMPPLQAYRDRVCAEAEARYLKDLMAGSGGNVKKACATAGLSQSRLYALLKRHDISH